jgi:hypothetical protein
VQIHRLWILFFLVVGIVSAGCGQEEKELHSPPMVLVEDEDSIGAPVDSLWHEVVPSIVGGPALDKEDTWIIEARWFRFAERPESLYTFSEMAHLDADGVIGDGTMVAMVRYRFLVEADGLPEAQVKVKARIKAPNWPPEKVYAAMAEADRKAATGERLLLGE